MCLDVGHISVSLVTNLLYAFKIATFYIEMLQLSVEPKYGSLFLVPRSLHDRS